MTYKCKYCSKDFARESTLAGHLCENKRRILDKDLKQNRIAYQSWMAWRRMSIANVKYDKPYEEFIANRYFTGFMKLSKRIIDLNIDDPEDFVKYISMNSVPMNKWSSDVVYEEYIKSKTRKETVARAMERSMITITEWADKTGNHFSEYFEKVNTVDAVQDIRMGRISPWCLFATDQGGKFVDRLEPNQIQALIDYIEPKSWRARVIREKEESTWIQDIFNKANIK